MKVSLSLSEDDVRYLDEQAQLGRYPSRSAAVSHAIRTVRAQDLTDMYVEDFIDSSLSA